MLKCWLLICTYIIISLSSISCSIPLKITMHTSTEEDYERKQIINTFDKEGQFIILAFEMNGISRIEIARELKEYGKPDFEGFIEYYFKRGYPFSDEEAIIQLRGEDYLDNLWQERKAKGSIADVRKTYNLLKEQ